MENPILNLRWRQHGLELTTLLDDVRRKGLYSDAIISCEDQHYPVHSALLAISSDFFAQIFKERCCDKNYIVIKDVLPFHLEKLLIYIYSGEVSIHQDEISKFLELAKSLQVKGTAFTYGDNSAISATSIDNLHNERLASNQMVEQLMRKDVPTQNISRDYISDSQNVVSMQMNGDTQTIDRNENFKNHPSNYMGSRRESKRPQCPATPSIPMDLTLNTTPNMTPSVSTSKTMPLPPLSSGTYSSSFPSSSHRYPSKSPVSVSANPEVSEVNLATLPSSTTLVNSVKSRVAGSITPNEGPHKEMSSFEALVKEEPNNSEDISDSDDIDRHSANAFTEAEVKTGEKKILGLLPPMIPLSSRNEETFYRLENFHNKIPTKHMPVIQKFTNEINQKVATCHSSAYLNQSALPRVTNTNGIIPIPSSEANSHLRPSDENCSGKDYPEKNYTISPTDKVCYRVYPLGEAVTAKNSQCPYTYPHRLADGSHCHQHQKMATIDVKDLDPKVQVNRMEHSSEMNPVIVRDTSLSHRNPRLLVNSQPVGPIRYGSRFLGSHRNTSTSMPSCLTRTDRINISNSDVPESQKLSMPAESSGTNQMSSIYKNPLSNTTSDIVVSKDLQAQNFNLNSHSFDSSQNNCNVPLISPVGSVSLSSKDGSSNNPNGSDSDLFHDEGFSDVSSNVPYSSNSSYSSTQQPASNYNVYDSLPSTSRDNIEKTEVYSPEQNTLGSNKSTSKKEKSEDDPCLKRVQSNAHGKRFRGPKAWEFLARLLKDPSTNGNIIRWEDEENMVFRLVNPNEIARRWGSRQVKNSKCRSYENFARSLRYHYSTGALASVSERQLVYKFGPKAIKVLQEYDELFPKTGNKSQTCNDLLDPEREHYEYDSNSDLSSNIMSSERELSYKVGPKAIEDMVEYDSIFPKTGGKKIISEQIRPNLVHNERQHYDNIPQVNSNNTTVGCRSVVKPSMQLQTETISSNSADSTPVINLKDGIVFQPGIGSHNYSITYQTPSGSVLPVSNISAVPVPIPRPAVHVPRSAVHVPRASSSQHESTHPMTIPSNMNVPNHPGVNIKSRYTNLLPIRNVASTSITPPSVRDKTSVTSTPITQSITLPKFISKIKNVSNPTFLPSSQSPGDKKVNNGILANIKSTTTASADNSEKKCNDSSSKPNENSMNKGGKHNLEDNKIPVDFKKRWKNSYQP